MSLLLLLVVVVVVVVVLAASYINVQEYYTETNRNLNVCCTLSQMY